MLAQKTWMDLKIFVCVKIILSYKTLKIYKKAASIKIAFKIRC